MDPLWGLPKKYEGRMPRVKAGPSPCVFQLTALLNCYMDSNFNAGGRCAALNQKYEQCLKLNVTRKKRGGRPRPHRLTQAGATHSKSWQHKRLLKKLRTGLL